MAKSQYNIHGKRVGVLDQCNQCKKKYMTYKDGPRVSSVCWACRVKVRIKGEDYN